MIHFGEKSNSYGITAQQAIEILEQKTRIECEYVFPQSDSLKELALLTEDADIIIGTSATLDEKVALALLNATRLKLIQSVGAGVENFPLHAIRGKPVYLANITGANAVAVAEHAFALMLGLAKQICKKDNELKNGKWNRGTPLVQLEGKTLVIVGFGAIGQHFAKRAEAFDMTVVAVRRHPEKRADIPVERVIGLDGLRGALVEADFVVIAMPLTSETRDLMKAEELKSMKPSSYLVNVGRGPIVNEAALYRALNEGWIAGAGIDTWYAYPPNPKTPSEYSIHKLRNVIATPLIGSTTTESIVRIFDLVAANIDAVASGERPRKIVDLELGY